MVRNSELSGIGESSQEYARGIRLIIESKNITQETVANWINRAQSYASLRIKGLKAWNLNEIEILSGKLGYSTPFMLLEDARARAEEERNKADGDAIISKFSRNSWALAASRDANKEKEREENY